jgi:DNA-binding MarR family transcriptional regulator
VVKEAFLEDKRFVQLYPTEQGKQIIPQIKKTFLELIEISTRNLSEQEAEQTVSLLKIILDGLVEEKTQLISAS